MSQRHACRLLDVKRSTVRYSKRGSPENDSLRLRIKELADKKKSYGYRMVLALLKRDGWAVNHKRVFRIWQAEGLQQPRKVKKKRAIGPSGEMLNKAKYPNHVWSYDFVSDSMEFGRKYRVLNIIDEHTRKSLFHRVEYSIPAAKVINTLDWLFQLYGKPEYIRSDNGPEFVAKEVRDWLAAQGCETIFIKPGSPWENAYIESFNGTFRTECLNRNIFRNIKEARKAIENWQLKYNEERPHSSLGYMTPEEFWQENSSSLRTTSFVHLNSKETELTLT